MRFVLNVDLLISLFVCYTGLAIMGGTVIGYFIGKYSRKKLKSEKIW